MGTREAGLGEDPEPLGLSHVFLASIIKNTSMGEGRIGWRKGAGWRNDPNNICIYE
jgi:hypothetical protein